jgi:hypothetical protein
MVADKDKVPVQMSLRWGKRWTGSCYEQTVGKGLYAEVMEKCTVGQSMFRGCPAGNGPSEAAALADFVCRAFYEFLGEGPLTVDHLKVVDVKDYRS